MICKKKIYFITATNTDVGKSYASEVFLNNFSLQGKKVGYYKPIETGVKDKPIDGTKLLNITKKLNPSFKFSINDIVSYQFKLPAAPFVAKENSIISIDNIKQNITKLLERCDILIIEGAGGLMVPIEKNYFMIDLILELQTEFNSRTILISPSNLGSINDTMLSQKALENYGIDYEWYINLFKDKDTFNTITLPFYKEYFGKMKYLNIKGI